MAKPYLNKAQLAAELEKCLQCKTKPCEKACPVGCSPHDFIAAAKCGDMPRAAELIAAKNPLGETCGLICPDKFCMRACLRQHIDASIRIPAVQAEIMRRAREENLPAPVVAPTASGMKVAIVGSGPAAAGAAAELLKSGFAVTVFEKENNVGGALNLIPEERLPREITAYEWQRLAACGALEIRLNTQVKDYSLLLQQGFTAVIVATGEQKSRTLGIEGEALAIDYTEYLKNPQAYAASGNVAIIGGGAAAVDCAVTAAKQGAKHVEMFVRRALSNMRITPQERASLLENRIDITTMTRPTKIEKNRENLTLYTCKTQFNDEGKLEDIPQSEIVRKGFVYIVLALGSTRGEDICESENIYYAGDFINGGSTAVEAVASGKKTAREIINVYNPQNLK